MKKEDNYMALPIRETPILRGKNARKFAENARTASSRPVPKEVYDRAQKTYSEMKQVKERSF
jgi:hypothetical protein